MKRIAWLLATMLLTLGAVADEPTPQTLQGLWSATSRSNGGLGAQWYFSGDDRFESYFGAVVDYKFALDGHTMKLTFPPSNGQPGETVEAPIVLSGDTLTVYPDDPQKRRDMKRVGAAPLGPLSIAGDWTFQHYTGTTAYEHYSRSGAAQLNVRMTTKPGTYTITPGHLTLKLEGEPVHEFAVSVNGDVMTANDGKISMVFKRFRTDQQTALQ